MGFFRLVTRLLLFQMWYFILTIQKQCQKSNRPFFTREPYDDSIKEGQNAVLFCAVQVTNPNAVEIEWYVGPDVNRKDVSTSYNAQSEEFTSTITVYNVDKTNLHLACIVDVALEAAQGNKKNTCRVVKRAYLVIEYFPHQDDLLCSPSHLRPLHLGDVLLAKCEVPRCEPAVDLLWQVHGADDGSVDLPLPKLEDKGLSRILTTQLQIDRHHHLMSLTCLVTSEVSFPGRELRCAIGPLQVLQPPIVQVHPRQVNMSASYPIQMFCNGTGFPDITFVWTCSPEDVLRGCSGTSGNITLSVSETSEYTGNILVYCIGSNSEGIGSDGAHIALLKNDNLHQPSTEASVDATILSHVVNITLTQGVAATSVEIQCTLSSAREVMSTPNFLWNIDNVPVEENSPVLIRQYTSMVSSLLLYKQADSKLHRNISCLAVLANETVEGSVAVFIDALESKEDHTFESVGVEEGGNVTVLTSAEISRPNISKNESKQFGYDFQ